MTWSVREDAASSIQQPFPVAVREWDNHCHETHQPLKVLFSQSGYSRLFAMPINFTNT
jgi:hypothetical protein